MPISRPPTHYPGPRPPSGPRPSSGPRLIVFDQEGGVKLCYFITILTTLAHVPYWVHDLKPLVVFTTTTGPRSPSGPRLSSGPRSIVFDQEGELNLLYNNIYHHGPIPTTAPRPPSGPRPSSGPRLIVFDQEGGFKLFCISIFTTLAPFLIGSTI